LNSLTSQSYKNYKIIVINDGSSDDTIDQIKKNYHKVILLNGDGNLWWSGATNLGIKYAIKNSAQYVLTLNNDLVVNYDYLQNMINAAEEFQNSIIGSISISNEDKETIIDGGGIINKYLAKRKDLFSGKKYTSLKNRKSLYSVNVLSGRGTLIPACVFSEIGLFNNKLLPQYGADYEFSIRALKHGYRLYINYNAAVFSFEGRKNIKKRYSDNSYTSKLKSFFDIRSSNCIKYRFRFAYLSYGWFIGINYFVFDLLRVIFSNLFNVKNFNK